MGIALKDRIIPDLHAPVRDIVQDGSFESEQNSKITWAHLLQLTSEWRELSGINRIGLTIIEM